MRTWRALYDDGRPVDVRAYSERDAAGMVDRAYLDKYGPRTDAEPVPVRRSLREIR